MYISNHLKPPWLATTLCALLLCTVFHAQLSGFCGGGWGRPEIMTRWTIVILIFRKPTQWQLRLAVHKYVPTSYLIIYDVYLWQQLNAMLCAPQMCTVCRAISGIKFWQTSHHSALPQWDLKLGQAKPNTYILLPVEQYPESSKQNYSTSCQHDSHRP